MHTLGDMAKALDRPVVCLTSLRKRFELPVFAGAGYSDAYLALLQTALALDMFAIGIDRQVRRWRLGKKLLELLHVDSAGSKTWFLDSCGATTRPKLGARLCTKHQPQLVAASHRVGSSAVLRLVLQTQPRSNPEMGLQSFARRAIQPRGGRHLPAHAAPMGLRCWGTAILQRGHCYGVR